MKTNNLVSGGQIWSNYVSTAAPRHFLTLVHPSPVARRLLLHLFSIRRGFMDRPASNLPFSKPGACIFSIASGRGVLHLDDTEWELSPGPHVWVYSSDRTRLFVPAPGQTLVTEAIWFGGPGLEGWLEELAVKRQPEFKLSRPARLARSFTTLRQLAKRQPPNWEWRLHRILSDVLGELLLASNRLTTSRAEPPAAIAQVLNAIETDRVRDWKTSELAELAGMSYSSFRTLFREAMHEAPHHYLQRVRLDLAREMLADPKLRIKEIAQKLQFSSVHYFSSFFHQHEGLSPTEFREHLGFSENTPLPT